MNVTVDLRLGDCLELLKSLPDGSVDAVITDPPYGTGFVKKTSDYRHGANFDNGESLKASRLYFDDPLHVVELIRAVMPEILRVAKRALIFPGLAMMYEYPKPKSVGGVFMANGAGSCSWGFVCFHPILYYGKDPYLQAGKGSRPNAFRTEQPNREKIDHPCPKPLEWMKWAVQRATFEGQTVLDPFMGSGTTGVACIELGRRFVGMEIDEYYYSIAQKRIAEAQQQLRMEVACG